MSFVHIYKSEYDVDCFYAQETFMSSCALLMGALSSNLIKMGEVYSYDEGNHRFITTIYLY